MLFKKIIKLQYHFNFIIMDLKRWSKSLVKFYEFTKSMFAVFSKPAVAVIQLQ
jgi:hypothetical protein